ncbi:hypothetical protein [Fuchsiella alkaliacetigena]|uniref:hypothetical protein n=1 Tax=Fuchsiella alkaliacetigena TaxID=957042 RepID=UPI00200A5030|nr:hypothetical protein [Fuchsiella alkaliacetigena]MCK8824312.1 hypothetical protein [Fuchsiella alkaliacetigena]
MPKSNQPCENKDEKETEASKFKGLLKDLDEDAVEYQRKIRDEYEKRSRLYELGKDLFGVAGTGDTESSTTYKEKVAEEINAKFND